MKCKAKFKTTGGISVMLCAHCSTIIKYSNVFTDDEWLASKGEKKIPGQLCDICEEKRNNYGKD